jgi:hypothetical protein
MSLPIELRVDHERRPRARWLGIDPSGRSLADFLELDLGFHRAFGERIREEGRRIVATGEGRYAASGNAFSLAIDPAETVVVPLLDSIVVDPVTVPTDLFLDVVDRWLALVEGLQPDE